MTLDKDSFRGKFETHQRMLESQYQAEMSLSLDQTVARQRGVLQHVMEFWITRRAARSSDWLNEGELNRHWRRLHRFYAENWLSLSYKQRQSEYRQELRDEA